METKEILAILVGVLILAGQICFYISSDYQQKATQLSVNQNKNISRATAVLELFILQGLSNIPPNQSQTEEYMNQTLMFMGTGLDNTTLISDLNNSRIWSLVGYSLLTLAFILNLITLVVIKKQKQT